MKSQSGISITAYLARRTMRRNGRGWTTGLLLISYGCWTRLTARATSCRGCRCTPVRLECFTGECPSRRRSSSRGPATAAGIVMHARRGGGTRIDGESVPVLNADAPDSNRLVTLPGGFGALFSVRRALRSKAGELRMTGSIAYELAMVAKGVTQYTITTAPFVWDAAAGSLLVKEAGGIVLQGGRRKLLGRLPAAWAGSQWNRSSLPGAAAQRR